MVFLNQPAGPLYMVQMRQVVANLRLNLAEIIAREATLNDQITQFKNQLERLPRQAVYGRVSLDMSLNVMSEIEERLENVKISHRHLLRIKERAKQELEALEVVQRVEHAKKRLSQIKSQGFLSGSSERFHDEEIIRLQDCITGYSRQAERAIITMSRTG